MYHYNFTNDLRISTLDEILRDAANAYLTDTVPSASEDKSKNNNYNTVGFYFNLKAKGNCAKLASKNQIKKVVLNFIKKFQYPNPRTPNDYTNAKNDGILLAPMRDIVKLLHIFSLINSEESYLTKEEIIYFIFYNNDLAKQQNYNLLATASQIIQYRKDHKLPSNIDTDDSSHEWNQPERQIREMIKTLNYSGCISEEGDKIKLVSNSLSRDKEADLFEITNCNTYWTGEGIEDYQKYMDDIDITGDDMAEVKEYKGDSLNRIIFGAPGTGKSHKLDAESSSFLNQEQAEDDIEKIINNDINIASNGARKLNALNALGFTYADYLKNISKSDLAEKYSNVQSIGELYVGSRAKEIAEQLVVDTDADDYDEKLTEEIEKAKNGKLMIINLNAIGYKYSDYLCEKTLNQLKTDYNLTSDAQMWWLYRGAQAGQLVEKKEIKQNIKFLERVTFHPNYSYSQFVGTYKPMKSKLNQEDITYEYVPGPFMRVYVNAKRNPEKNFLLLIEEINRANVAAVFGDVFQLLDRKNDGTSQYPISASEDQKNYLESCGINEDEIAIPSNMYIWATMNSADQGVLPMDAAFKRRWDFEYLDVDNEAAVNQIKDIEIPISRDGKKTVKWNEFRTQLNDKLSDIGVNEDKLLGPFFMSKKSLDNAMNDPEKFVELFESKVIMYLFEDVVKMQPAKLFTTGTRRYSKLCKEFEDKGMEIFGIDVEVTEVQ